MKLKLTIVLVAIMSAMHFTADAQISFSCEYREYCYWNDRTEEFEDCEGYEESSLFVMNEDETMFTHTIESMKSAYYVSESEWDEETNIFTYTVISDVGNDYIYMFSPDDYEIGALFYDDYDNLVLLTFYVKSIF
ncbi:MAG: hypothetical protein ACPG4Z_00820 [Chitinophagales bacterium]